MALMRIGHLNKKKIIILTETILTTRIALFNSFKLLTMFSLQETIDHVEFDPDD